MNEVIWFVPRADADARERIADFIALARDRLTALVSQSDWDKDVWDASGSFVRKGKQNAASRLHFFRCGTQVGRGDNVSGTPFEEPFGDFARAFIRYQHSVAPVVFERLKARLRALSYLDAAFRSLNRASDITTLSADVLFAAVRIGGERVQGAARYQRAAMLQAIFEFCRDRGFLATPFVWKHGVRKAPDVTERIGDDFAERRAAKVPGRKAIDILALAYCKPTNFRDRMLSAVTAICMCVPIRIHEVLQLKVDCGCEGERRNGEDAMVPAFGFRVFPGKGNLPQIKWVPDIMADLGREARNRLRDIGAQARAIAAWYVENPTKVYLPQDAEHLRDAALLTADEVGNLLGRTRPGQWAHATECMPPVKSDTNGAFSYRFEDFERAVLAQLPRDFPRHNGHATHPYSESLILVRRGGLRANTVGEGSRVMFEPIGIDAYGQWLRGTTGKGSVFTRYGFVAEDGSPIEHTSHGFRHWLNDIAHRKGLNAMDIAHWSGRNPAQNKFYDHQTPAEFHSQLRDMAEKAGGMGPLFEAADALPDPQLISRGEFLASQIGSAHQTDLGACIHDYTLLPCQRNGNCLGCDESVFIKGDQKHQAGIQARHDLTDKQLEAARASMEEGDYGADLWVQDHKASLRRLALMLSIHGDPSIADGTVVTLPADGGDTEVSLALRQRDARAAV